MAYQSFGHYMQEKIQKLSAQQQLDFDKADNDENAQPRFFEGVHIFVTGYTQPSFQELRELIVAHGGLFSHYYTRKSVTHIIATELASCKRQDFKNCRVVKPDWIVDSIRQHRLLDWKLYALSLQSTTELQRSTQSLLFSGSSTTVKSTKSSPTPTPVETHEPEKSFEETLNASTKDASPRKVLSATDPDFVRRYFEQSRLHHLSTWKRELQQYTHRSPSLSNDHSPSAQQNRVIFHVDFDSFFISVAAREDTSLSRIPAAVAHSKGNNVNPLGGSSTSEIASCNYLARQKGVKNGMIVGKALALCPELKLVGYDFATYEQILLEYADALEAVSCDEALVEVTNRVLPLDAHNENYSEKIAFPHPNEVKFQDISKTNPLDKQSSNSATDLAKRVHAHLQRELRLPLSIGIGTCPLHCRLALKKAKPNGIFVLPPSEWNTFTNDLSIDDLPGVGWSWSNRLRASNIITIGALRDALSSKHPATLDLGIPKNVLQAAFGRDDRIVAQDAPAKPYQHSIRPSITVDINWGIRCQHWEEVWTLMDRVVDELILRMDASSPGNRAPLVGSKLAVTLRIRHPEAPVQPNKYLGCGITVSYTKQMQCAPTRHPDRIKRDVRRLGESLREQLWRERATWYPDLEKISVNALPVDLLSSDVRGVGLQMSQLRVEQASFLDRWVGSPGSSETKGKKEMTVNNLSRLSPGSGVGVSKKRQKPAQANVSPLKRIKTPERKPTEAEIITMSQIDQNVWEALPNAIRQEYLLGLQRIQGKKSPNQVKVRMMGGGRPATASTHHETASPDRLSTNQQGPIPDSSAGSPSPCRVLPARHESHLPSILIQRPSPPLHEQRPIDDTWNQLLSHLQPSNAHESSKRTLPVHTTTTLLPTLLWQLHDRLLDRLHSRDLHCFSDYSSRLESLAHQKRTTNGNEQMSGYARWMSLDRFPNQTAYINIHGELRRILQSLQRAWQSAIS